MGYEFHDFGQTAVTQPLSIRTIINGKTLDYMYDTDGFTFTTLSVSGRANTSYDVDAVSSYGREGALQRKRKLNPRTITVKAYVVALSNEDYRRGMSKLNAILYAKELHKIQFTDDELHAYYGTVIRVEDSGEESNRQVVEIEFVCNDPFKYTEVLTDTVTQSEKLRLKTDVPIIADEIELNFPSNVEASNFTLMNVTTGKKIVFNQAVTSNLLRIRQKEDGIFDAANINRIRGLNIKYSNFDSFKISDGDVIWTSPAPELITVTYRGAKL